MNVPLTQGFGQPMRTSFSDFGNNRQISGTKQFLESNSLVAKVAFLILVVIMFVLLLRLGTSLLSWIFTPSGDPTLMKGMKPANKSMIITQNPSLSSSIPVLRSVDQTDGIEFTYSTWIYINSLTNNGQYKHIFHKGNDNFVKGLNQPNNAPGLYIHPSKNALVVIMNTFNDINEEILVNDIPLNKWINVIIRVEGDKVDVYINGTIVVRHELQGVPKQNYGDVYINQNNGFDGDISSLKYFNKALNTSEILEIVHDGPDMTINKSMDVFPPYFSLKWYLNN